MELARASLEDKYPLQSGRIYLSGIQALVRLPMMQRERDNGDKRESEYDNALCVHEGQLLRR